MIKKYRILFSFFIVIIFFIVSNLVVSKSLDVFKVNGDSMNPTFKDGDKISVMKKKELNIKEGDIIFIEESPYFENKYNYFLKRVIAIEGEEISFAYTENNIISLFKKINGEWIIIDEPFIKETMNERCFKNCIIHRSKEEINKGIIIEQNSVFVMGDNRNYSIDSRSIGQIKLEHIINCLSM